MSFGAVVLCDEPAYSAWARFHDAGIPLGVVLEWNSEGEESDNPFIFNPESCFLGLDVFSSCNNSGLPQLDEVSGKIMASCDLADASFVCNKTSADSPTTAGYECTFDYVVTSQVLAEVNGDVLPPPVVGQVRTGKISYALCDEEQVERPGGEVSVYSEKRFPNYSTLTSTNTDQFATCTGDSLEPPAGQYIRSLVISAEYVVEARSNIINPYRTEAIPTECSVALTTAAGPLALNESFTYSISPTNAAPASRGC